MAVSTVLSFHALRCKDVIRNTFNMTNGFISLQELAICWGAREIGRKSLERRIEVEMGALM